MTMGNHTYGQREIYDFIDEAKPLVRPANFWMSAGNWYEIYTN